MLPRRIETAIEAAVFEIMDSADLGEREVRVGKQMYAGYEAEGRNAFERLLRDSGSVFGYTFFVDGAVNASELFVTIVR
jgi:hypothetical protein